MLEHRPSVIARRDVRQPHEHARRVRQRVQRQIGRVLYILKQRLLFLDHALRAALYGQRALHHLGRLMTDVAAVVGVAADLVRLDAVAPGRLFARGFAQAANIRL